MNKLQLKLKVNFTLQHVLFIMLVLFGYTFSSWNSQAIAAGLPVQPDKGSKSAKSIHPTSNYDLALDFFTAKDPQTATLIDTRSRYAVPLRKGKFSIGIDLESATSKREQIWVQLSASPSGKSQFSILNSDNIQITPKDPANQSNRLIINGEVSIVNSQLKLSALNSKWAKKQVKKAIQNIKNTSPIHNAIVRKKSPEANFISTIDQISKQLKLKPGEFRAYLTVHDDDLHDSSPVRVYASEQFLSWFSSSPQKKLNILSRPFLKEFAQGETILKFRITYSDNNNHLPIASLEVTGAIDQVNPGPQQSNLQSTVLSVINARVTLKLNENSTSLISYHWKNPSLSSG
ncbi:MAG: hypothetical protein ACWA5R_03415 [bacterium]